MTALIQEKMSLTERWTYHQFPLAVGNKAFKNGLACLDLSTAKVEPGHVESDLFVMGRFAETVDATLVEKLVNVNFGMEIEVEWWANGTGTIAATDVGSLCYVQDDQTVTITPTGASVAGRIWAVDSVKGVAVQKLNSPSQVATLDGLGAVTTVLPAFSAGALAVANNPNSNAIYDVPTTAAASVITLPATAVAGTILYFSADGTKNGHTVTYKDGTGAVALTTALTASKRHLVIAAFVGTLWFANAYVSP